MIPRLLCCVALFATTCSSQDAPSFDRAEMFYEHGLVDDAKRDLIRLLTMPGSAKERAPARMLLARIALDEDRLTHAVELWQQVADRAGQTRWGAEAKRLLESSNTPLVGFGREQVASAVASSYLTFAEYWLSELGTDLQIETAWIESSAAAVYWLDRVLEEFPTTPAAELAYEWKVRAFIGQLEGPDVEGSGALGALSRLRTEPERSEEHGKAFARNIELAEATLGKMNEAFPESARLQRLRFLLAHAYWLHDDQDQARPWLNAMIAAAGAARTFWKHLASLCLSR